MSEPQSTLWRLSEEIHNALPTVSAPPPRPRHCLAASTSRAVGHCVCSAWCIGGTRPGELRLWHICRGEYMQRRSLCTLEHRALFFSHARLV